MRMLHTAASALKLHDMRACSALYAQVAITAMSTSPLDSGELLTGSFDGVVCCWSSAGSAQRFTGQLDKSICGAVHGNKVRSCVA